MPAITRKIIGAREKVTFSELSIKKFTARVDTGAKTSSVHCDQYWFEKENGRKILYTKLLGLNKTFRFTKYAIRTVRSSNGHTEHRFVINLSMKIGDRIHLVEFTLTDRQKMKNRVLLGRRFLRRNYLVDVSRNFTQGK